MQIGLHQSKKALHIVLDEFVGGGIFVVGILTKDGLQGLLTAVVGGELVLVLLVVAGEVLDLGLAFAAQAHTDGREKLEHYVLLEVVALDEEIGVVGDYAEAFQLGLHSLYIGQGLGVTAREPTALLLDTYAQLLEGVFGMGHAHGVETHDVAEVLHGEHGELALAIKPYVPQEERIDNLRVEAEEGREVDHGLVVEGALHAYSMQALGIALVVLYGIGIGMEHIGTAYDAARGVGLTLQQVVVVTVDTGYHVTAEPLTQVIHHGHLLALGERGV